MEKRRMSRRRSSLAKLVEVISPEELFAELNTNQEEAIYIKHIVARLKEVNPDMDKNLRAKHLFDQYDSQRIDYVTLPQFKELMIELEDAQWRRLKIKRDITEMDIKAVFRMVDVDKSASISRTEAKMASKLLLKRFGVKDAPSWMKQTDTDHDGRISYEEFKDAVLLCEKANSVESAGAAVADILTAKSEKRSAAESALIQARNAANMSPVSEDSPHEPVGERRASDLACILDKVLPRRESAMSAEQDAAIADIEKIEFGKFMQLE